MQPDASGKLPTSIDSITDPAVHDIYNNNTRLRASMNKQFAANAVGGYAPTEANQAQYHYLRGMFLDPLAPADARAEAMQTNIESLEMVKWVLNRYEEGTISKKECEYHIIKMVSAFIIETWGKEEVTK